MIVAASTFSVSSIIISSKEKPCPRIGARFLWWAVDILAPSIARVAKCAMYAPPAYPRLVILTASEKDATLWPWPQGQSSLYRSDLKTSNMGTGPPLVTTWGMTPFHFCTARP